MTDLILYMSGGRRPGLTISDPPELDSLTVSIDEQTGLAAIAMKLLPVSAGQPEGRYLVNLPLIPINKTWAHRAPWISSLAAPAMTVLEVVSETQLRVTIAYQIPEYPDWIRTRIKSSVDGVLSLLNVVPSSGEITDHGATLTKTVWQDSATVIITLAQAENTDFIWAEHEYEFGGIVNSDLLPLPAGNTTTTTTTQSTTTTTAGTTTTTGTTTTQGTTSTTTTTTAGTTTTTTIGIYSATYRYMLLGVRDWKYSIFVEGGGYTVMPYAEIVGEPLAGHGSQLDPFIADVTHVKPATPGSRTIVFTPSDGGDVYPYGALIFTMGAGLTPGEVHDIYVGN